MTKLDALREVVEERIDYCFRALPSRSDMVVNLQKYRELKAMINCYQFILDKIKELQSNTTLEQDHKDPLKPQ